MLSRLRRAWCFLTERHHSWVTPVVNQGPFLVGDIVEVHDHPYISIPAVTLGTVVSTWDEEFEPVYNVRLCSNNLRYSTTLPFVEAEVRGVNWRDWHNLPRCG